MSPWDLRLANKLRARTGAASFEEALAIVGRKLQAWHDAKARYFDQFNSGIGLHEVGQTGDYITAQRELQELIKP